MTDAEMIRGLMAIQERFMLAGDDSHDEMLSQCIARIMYLPKQVDKMLHPTNSTQEINKVISFIWGVPE
jgi:hypothetical protein